jgi:hypothetical protein
MRKRLLGIAVAGAGVLGLAMPAAAHGDVPEHGHIKLVNVDLAEFTYTKCIDLPSGRGNSWKAHHYGIHTGEKRGNAGSLFESSKGRHLVFPTSELSPDSVANCEELAQALNGG